jgi:hypothetical protein
LHNNGLRIEVQVESMARFRRVPQADVSSGHFGSCHGSAKPSANAPKWYIRNARHGCKQERALDVVWTDAHDEVLSAAGRR